MEARSHPRGAGPTFDAPTRQPKGSYPQVVPESFTNDSKERCATDLKILFQRKDIVLPRDRELVGQLHSIKRRVLASGKVSFDAERTTRAATPIASGPSRSPARRNAGRRRGPGRRSGCGWWAEQARYSVAFKNHACVRSSS